MHHHPTRNVVIIHAILIVFAVMTLAPFAFTVNNIFRTNPEFYRKFMSVPDSLEGLTVSTLKVLGGNGDIMMDVVDADGFHQEIPASEAVGHYWSLTARGPRLAWGALRPYMWNTLVVAAVTALGVIVIGSGTAYVLSRYRFPGHKIVFMAIISTMMFPAVLTLVPSFMVVRELGLLNTKWAMILPYVAGGQVFAIFVFKSFFEGLPEDLFESARIDGAGHLRIYWNIVLPLSKPVISVVVIMNILATWNNFLWPFITNTEGKNHVIASGLYVMATSTHASNMATMYAAYAISSIPLLILFVYATKPFIQGMTSGAFKA